VQLDRPSDWNIINGRRMTDSRGKNTCEAPEIAAAMRLQVPGTSGGLCISKAPCRPYESNAKENAQSRGLVKDMSDPVRVAPQNEALYMVQKMSDKTAFRCRALVAIHRGARTVKNQHPREGKTHTECGVAPPQAAV
jgi:hypothetical protein